MIIKYSMFILQWMNIEFMSTALAPRSSSIKRFRIILQFSFIIFYTVLTFFSHILAFTQKCLLFFFCNTYFFRLHFFTLLSSKKVKSFDWVIFIIYFSSGIEQLELWEKLWCEWIDLKPIEEVYQCLNFDMSTCLLSTNDTRFDHC